MVHDAAQEGLLLARLAGRTLACDATRAERAAKIADEKAAWEKELSPPEAASLALAWVAADRAACDAEDKLDLYGLQALAMRAVGESGECFIRLLTVPTSPRNPIGLSLQVLESDHLDTTRNGMVDGAPTIQGIALGSAGEPIGYWLFPTHPGAWMLLGARLTSNFIPARDVSWLAPVLLRSRDLGDYEAALLMKAKIETCLAAVTDDGEETLTKAKLQPRCVAM